jgi:hypothetical protein
MPLTVEERKEISKAKKLEKYTPRVNGNNASAELDVENEEAADTNTNTEAPQAESSTNLNDLRERLQVSPTFMPHSIRCFHLRVSFLSVQARIQGMKAQRASNKPQKGSKDNSAKPVTPAAASGAEQATAKTLSTSDKKNKHKLEAQERQEAKRVRRAGTAINDATDVSIISLGSQDSARNAKPDTTDDMSVNTGSVLTSATKPGGVPSDLHFSLIAQSTVLGEAAGEGELAAKAAKPKGNKLQRLQRLLSEAEKKRARMKQLTAHGGEEGLARLQGEKWNDALKSAKGERTLIVGSSSIEGSEGMRQSVRVVGYLVQAHIKR